MSEESEIVYQDGEIVWVKLGSCWWPGEIVGIEKLPPDLFSSFKKPPIAVVKFFQEDTYEYVKTPTSIYKYNCHRKDEFINKGLYMYRTKHGPMEKFPEDVIRAETATGGDIEILTRDEFQETKKESYAGLFGTPKSKTSSGSSKKGQGRKMSESSFRPTRMSKKEKSDYKVHILLQGGNTPENVGTVAEPSTSVNETVTPKKSEPSTTTYSTPTTQSGMYSCHACSFTTSRLNVMILHNKTHSATFMPYTPSPIRKNTVQKSTKPQSTESVKDTEIKTPKARRPRKEKSEKVFKKPSGQKRLADETKIDDAVKKPRTEEEIKSSLLADWEDVDDNSDSESSVMVEKLIRLADESPAEPTPAELPSAQVPEEISTKNDKKSEGSSTEEKPESSSSKYDFCEDEDWPEEADVGRKIPRVKNPSKRKDDTKSVSLDDDEMTREVAELLSKTALPELPSAPEPLKVEENFPKPALVKSPDKNIQCVSETSISLDNPATEAPPTKAIFKTKTFFRSRHSRSQDAIGKYVAEQLNAAERMDCDAEINGADTVSSSPEARDSPPIEHIKVARLAPKIQLKKLKAQLQEKEKTKPEHLVEDVFSNFTIKSSKPENLVSSLINENKEDHTPKHGMVYPNREIKPTPDEAHKEILTDIPVDENKPHLETAKNMEKAETTDHIKDNFVSQVNKTEGESSLVSLPSDKKINADREVCVEISENYEEQSDRFINESTASAVDALLSVSRETDRVTKNISDDPPEDLFEDDNTAHNINGFQEKVVEDLLHDNDSKQSECAYKPVKDDENINQDITQDTPSEIVSVKESTVNIHESMNEISIISHEQRIADVEPITKADNIPSESDLQIAETLINLPATAIQNKILDDSQEIHPACSSIDGDLNEEIIETSEKTMDVDTPENNVYTEQSVDTTNFVTPENTIETSETIMNIKTIDNTMDIETSENNLVIETQGNLILETPEDMLVETSQSNLIVDNNLVVETSESNLVHENSENSVVVETSKSVAVTEIPEVDSNKSLIKRDNKILNYEMSSNSHISNSRTMNIRFETEQEKSENLNAAQSLVQMSESIVETSPVSEVGGSSAKVFSPKQTNGVEKSLLNQNVELLENKNNNTTSTNGNVCINFDTNSSKLLKILEEPSKLKVHTHSDKVNNTTPAKRVIVTEKERILNFDVGKMGTKGKMQSPKQKIIIRRATTNKSILSNLSEASSSNKLVLACNSKTEQEGSPVKTYTIRASSDTSNDPNTIIIQPKLRKIKSCAKVQKLKPQTSLIAPIKDLKTTTKVSASDDTFFDINSMPVVLSDDILTPESIEKMPIVMTDGNIISQSSHSPKIVKQKQTIAGNEKTAIAPLTYKQEMKTLLMNPVEGNKITTPNILSKSTKLRPGKPMLIIDKMTGKQKIIMSKPEPAVSELKQQTKLLQTPQPTTQTVAKTDQFIILPSASTGRPGRAQKIVIDPQTGKAHVIVTKGTDTSANETKTVSTKLIPSPSEAISSSNTVMIITNAQGAQSRIVLTPEHEKILFPNKQQPNISQLKAITTQRTNTLTLQPKLTPQLKTQSKIVPKPKSTIITSKGQLLVGGRVTTTVQNIVPMPEIRVAPKRLIATEPKKLVQAKQKSNSEPMIILQQKPGTVMQLTAAQFEHLQRTGQLVASRPASENKIIIQKSITIPPGESIVKSTVKQRARKTVVESPTLAKRMKQEIAFTPATVLSAPMPSLTPLSNTAQGTAHVFTTSSTASSLLTTNTYSDLEHLDEILPSTAIAKHPEPVLAPAPPDLLVTASAPALAPVPTITPAPVPAPLTDGQLVAVPGESFGGPQASFYLCFEENGTLTQIDSRPLILENNQLVPMTVDPVPALAPQPERRDILEAALANSDVFHADTPRDETTDFRDLNANVSVHRGGVSETSTTLNQPIMCPVEMPTKADSEPAVPSNLEDGLAVIGVTAPTVPTSLELPITVTDPRIAPKTTDPLSNNNYGAALLTHSNADLSFVTAEETEVSLAGPISMPLLTEEESVGKSMPLLTDEISERAVSSVESTVDSLCSEAEVEVGMGPLITPGSDCSDNSANSAEIPLQPAIMLSANDLARDS